MSLMNHTNDSWDEVVPLMYLYMFMCVCVCVGESEKGKGGKGKWCVAKYGDPYSEFVLCI